MNLDTIMIGNVSLTQIVFALLLTVCGAIAINIPYWKPKGKKRTCSAWVKSKRIEYSNTPQIYYRGNRWNYLITFECEDGTTVELHVNEEMYGQMKEGTVGMLTYQGDKLLSYS